MVVGVVLSKKRKGGALALKWTRLSGRCRWRREWQRFTMVSGPPSSFARMVKVAVRRRRSEFKRASRPRAVSQGQEPYLMSREGCWGWEGGGVRWCGKGAMEAGGVCGRPSLPTILHPLCPLNPVNPLASAWSTHCPVPTAKQEPGREREGKGSIAPHPPLGSTLFA